MKKIANSTIATVVLPLLLVISSFSGCGRGGAYILPHQTWNKTEFVVEVRPGAPRVGMNEFVVIATQLDGVPGYNYVITIKTNLNANASQMIQDGHSGVYRRAIEIKDPANEVLLVDIVQKPGSDLKTELRFPLSKHL